jgi:hypothetical protein
MLHELRHSMLHELSEMFHLVLFDVASSDLRRFTTVLLFPCFNYYFFHVATYAY